MFGFFLFVVGLSPFGDLELLRIKKIEIESSNLGFTNFVFLKNGGFFCADYWDSRIVRFDPEGRKLRTIANKGNGPGEVMKPQWLFLIEDERKLLVIESDSRWSTFSTGSGEFDRVITKYQPARIWEQLDGQSLVGIFNRTEHFFVKTDLHAEILDVWGEEPQEEPGVFWTRTYATALGPGETVFYQEGTWPEVRIYTKGRAEPSIWKLKLPKHYREPPDQPFDLRRAGFSREKLQEYQNSYTRVADFYMLRERFFTVIWEIYEPYSRSLDIYDYRTRSPVVENFVLPGKYHRSDGDQLFFLEEKESRSETGKDQLFMHIYALGE